jgi:hypothetical protein
MFLFSLQSVLSLKALYWRPWKCSFNIKIKLFIGATRFYWFSLNRLLFRQLSNFEKVKSIQAMLTRTQFNVLDDLQDFKLIVDFFFATVEMLFIILMSSQNRISYLLINPSFNACFLSLSKSSIAQDFMEPLHA